MDEQKLNKKLAEWAGFTQEAEEIMGERKRYFIVGRFWAYPNGDSQFLLPNFTQSLDACFKWLVPKLPEGSSLDAVAWNGYYDVTLWQRGIKPSGIEVAQCNIYAREYSQESLALALCLAIEKLIDGGE